MTLDPAPLTPSRLTRRRFLGYGLGAVAAISVGGYELVEHSVIPGKGELDRLTGACDVSRPSLTFEPPGPAISGSFFSRARRREVAYTISYPPGHRIGSPLPLVISLYGFGGDHASGLGGVSVASALAARLGKAALPPMAAVEVDGGQIYWNPHPGDNPQAMLVDEVIPMCRHLKLGLQRVGVVGISMGGYGALLLGERYPKLVSAVAAISPAVWTTYAEARAANPAAFASAADFSRDDVIAHAHALTGMPVRIASGNADPFHPGVTALAAALPSSATISFAAGCHDGSFFGSQQHQSLAFLGHHLT